MFSENGGLGWPSKWEPEQKDSWVVRDLAPVASIERVLSRCQLFAVGEPARYYFLLLSGDLLIFLPGVRSRERRTKSLVRFARPDELFVYDCDAVHVANCVAVSDCVVLCVDRLRLERLALFNRALRGELHRIRANEIAFLLQSICAASARVEDEHGEQPKV